MWAQELWHTSLVALQHVGAPQTRDQTCALSPALAGGSLLHHHGSPERFSKGTQEPKKVEKHCAEGNRVHL